MRWATIAELPVESRQKWAAGRIWAARQAPYMASALLALAPIVVEDHDYDLRAFPVDPAWHIYLDPALLETTTVPALGFWLVHQVAHLLRQHADRYPLAQQDGQTTGPLGGRSVEQRSWNIAGDAEIDDDLVAGEVTVPPEAVVPADIFCPDGWVAEQYFDVLTGGATRRPPPSDADRGGRAGMAGTGEKSAGRPTEGTGSGLPADSSVNCGSGCDGQERPWDCGRPGLDHVGRKLVARETAQRIKEHSRTRGDMPAGWQRWAEEVLEPAVNWQRVLSSTLRRGVADVAGRVDFSYRRPSRRAPAVPDVVLPSLRQPLPQVAMVLDTSGSMSDSMLAQALAEVSGVLRGLGIGRRHLRVVCCDATAYEAQRVIDAHDVRLLGGGGTDMGAGLAAAAELRPRPDLILVLTDGHTPWPSAPPRGARVIVGLMDHSGSVPGWATSVAIEPSPQVVRWQGDSLQ